MTVDAQVYIHEVMELGQKLTRSIQFVLAFHTNTAFFIPSNKELSIYASNREEIVLRTLPFIYLK